MSWKIKDHIVNADDNDEIQADFDVSGTKKSSTKIIYPGDHGMSEEELYDDVVKKLQDGDSEGVKDNATKEAEQQAKKDAKKVTADASVATQEAGSFKLKNLKDTDV